MSPGRKTLVPFAERRVLVTFADRLVVYVLVGAALVLMLIGLGGGPGAVVRITGEGGYERLARLDANERVEVEGPLGTTVVEVHNGAARVLSSPCPHGLCVRMGEARRPGHAVVCVPNRVVVTVVGEGGASTDAIAR